VCALIDDTELVAIDIAKPGHRKALVHACQLLRETDTKVQSRSEVKDDNKGRPRKEEQPQEEWRKKVSENVEEKLVENEERPPVPEKKEIQAPPAITPKSKVQKQQAPLQKHQTPGKYPKPKQISGSPQDYSQDTESSDTIFSESEEDIFVNK